MEGRADNRHGNNGPRGMLGGGEWIYGRNPAFEVLRAGRRKVLEMALPPASRNEPDEIASLRATARERGIPVRAADREWLDRLLRHAHHQGVALKVSGYPYADFGEIVRAAEEDENALVVALDHIEDPQNAGSILRSALCAGATGVIMPEDRSCGVTPAAVRASSGAAEHLRVARVVNMVRAIKELQNAGVWFTGLDMCEGSKPYTDVDFKGRAGIVVGAEGEGLSRLVRETCDFTAHLPMPGGFDSLNAGVAAGIALYEVLRQRG